MKTSKKYERLCPRCGGNIEQPYRLPLIEKTGFVSEAEDVDLTPPRVRLYCSELCARSDYIDGHYMADPDPYEPRLADWQMYELLEKILDEIQDAIHKK